jgi:hypothetical protein
MIHLGEILEVRDDPIRPLRVAVDVGDGALELDWVMVSLAVWTTVRFDDLEVGTQVSIWDTGFTASPDKYRVVDIWPSAKLGLGDNRKPLARRGDPVAITGNPKLTTLAAPTILTGVPPVFPLGHDLKGTILDD